MSFFARYPVTGGSGGVTTINSLTGAVTLAAGTGISISPSGNTLTIAATGISPTPGNLTDTGTDGIVITNGTNAVIGTGTTIAQHVADSTHNGYLSSTDWTTFNNNLTTSITGILKGNGTTISAATSGTDYVIPSGSITGTAGNITATSNSTLVTLSSLSLPYSQVTGTPTAGANTALSNLTTTSINQNLLPNANNAFALGQTGGAWNGVFTLGIYDSNGVGAIDVNNRVQYDLAGNMAVQYSSSGSEFYNSIILADSTTHGTKLTISSPTAYTNYTLTMPAATGTGALTNNGSGALSWSVPFTNPMNAAGQMISGGTSGALTRVNAGTTGQVLVSSGTTVAFSGTAAALTSAATLATVGTITTGVWNGTATMGAVLIQSGTTYTTPAGITTNTVFKFTLQGGGGGGGGAKGLFAAGGGGGGGGVGILFISGLTPSTAYTIAVGAAGAAGTNAPGNGGAGGNTTITIGASTYGGTGGLGGLASSAAAFSYAGAGAGGTNTGSITLNITGSSGGVGLGIQTGAPLSGFGGGSFFSGSSASVGGATIGTGASGFGGGGAGGSSGSATGFAGGAGGIGCILVEWQN